MINTKFNQLHLGRAGRMLQLHCTNGDARRLSRRCVATRAPVNMRVVGNLFVPDDVRSSIKDAQNKMFDAVIRHSKPEVTLYSHDYKDDLCGMLASFDNDLDPDDRMELVYQVRDEINSVQRHSGANYEHKTYNYVKNSRLPRIIQRVVPSYHHWSYLGVGHPYMFNDAVYIPFLTFKLSIMSAAIKHNRIGDVICYGNKGKLVGDFMLATPFLRAFCREMQEDSASAKYYLDTCRAVLPSLFSDLSGNVKACNINNVRLRALTTSVLYWSNKPHQQNFVDDRVHVNEEKIKYLWAGVNLGSMFREITPPLILQDGPFQSAKTSVKKDPEETAGIESSGTDITPLPAEKFVLGDELKWHMGGAFRGNFKKLLGAWEKVLPENADRSLIYQFREGPIRVAGTGQWIHMRMRVSSFVFDLCWNEKEDILKVTHPPYDPGMWYAIQGEKKNVSQCLNDYVFLPAKRLSLQGLSASKHLDVTNIFNNEPAQLFRFFTDVDNCSWMPKAFGTDTIKGTDPFFYLSEKGDEWEERMDLDTIQHVLAGYNKLLQAGHEYSVLADKNELCRFVQNHFPLCSNKKHPQPLKHNVLGLDNLDASRAGLSGKVTGKWAPIPEPNYAVELHMLPCPVDHRGLELSNNMVIAWVNTVRKEHLERKPLRPLDLKNPRTDYPDADEVYSSFQQFIERIGLDFAEYASLSRL